MRNLQEKVKKAFCYHNLPNVAFDFAYESLAHAVSNFKTDKTNSTVKGQNKFW